MRIFSKKTFQFDHPTAALTFVVVMAMAFSDVPDWVADSLMFKLAAQDEDVEVITSKADEVAAEKGTKTKTKAEKDAEAKAKAEAEAAVKAQEEADAAAKAEEEAAAAAAAAAAAGQ